MSSSRRLLSPLVLVCQLVLLACRCVVQPVPVVDPGEVERAYCQWQHPGQTAEECLAQDQRCDPCCLPTYDTSEQHMAGKSACVRCQKWRAGLLELDPQLVCKEFVDAALATCLAQPPEACPVLADMQRPSGGADAR